MDYPSRPSVRRAVRPSVRQKGRACVVRISATTWLISSPLAQVTLHKLAMSSNDFGCDSCSRSQVAPLDPTKLVSSISPQPLWRFHRRSHR